MSKYWLSFVSILIVNIVSHLLNPEHIFCYIYVTNCNQYKIVVFKHNLLTKSILLNTGQNIGYYLCQYK